MPPIDRRFPIQADLHSHATGGRSAIPWPLAERLYEDYVLMYGRGQTLERIAQRGGWGWNEMMTFMVEAAERREKMANMPDETLTEQARAAFAETSGTDPTYPGGINTSRAKTGGAW